MLADWRLRSTTRSANWSLEMRPLSDAIGGRDRVIGGPFGSKLTKADYVQSGVPVIRGSNMEHRGRWIGGEFAFVSPQKVKEDFLGNLARTGDVIVTQRGTLGQVSIVPKDLGFNELVVSQSQMAIRVDPHVANPNFVYYFLRSPEVSAYLDIMTVQTGVPHINLGLLRDVPTDWPSLRKQQAIASVLGSLDDKIDLNRRMNETLEAMARAIFKDWFVYFGPTRAKMEGRVPYLAPEVWSLFPERLDNEGKPQGWQLTVLREVLSELEAGGRPKGGVSGYRFGVPSIGAESIVGLGVFDYSKTKYIPQKFFEGRLIPLSQVARYVV
jgi:type I restriction enzyme S subunit